MRNAEAPIIVNDLLMTVVVKTDMMDKDDRFTFYKMFVERCAEESPALIKMIDALMEYTEEKDEKWKEKRT